MLLRSNFSHLQNAIFRGFYGPSRELQTFCIAETSQTELKLTTAVIPLVMQFSITWFSIPWFSITGFLDLVQKKLYNRFYSIGNALLLKIFLNSDEVSTYKSLIFFTIITKPSAEVRFNQIFGWSLRPMHGSNTILHYFVVYKVGFLLWKKVIGKSSGSWTRYVCI